MSNKNALESLGDYITEDILTMSDDEIESELRSLGINVDEKVSVFRQLVDVPSLAYRKARLTNAKAASNRINTAETSVNVILENLKATGHDIRTILSKLIFSGQVPKEITMAFRDGKEISDEEAESILEDLINLGVVKDDESDSSK